ncbi:MAG: hypothetical protein WC080_03340 [Patescibacteria group bacterium]
MESQNFWRSGGHDKDSKSEIGMYAWFGGRSPFRFTQARYDGARYVAHPSPRSDVEDTWTELPPDGNEGNPWPSQGASPGMRYSLRIAATRTASDPVPPGQEALFFIGSKRQE